MSAGGQGTVRYALMFDSTQAESSVKRFQSTLQQLGTSSTNVTRQIQGFTAGLNQNKSAFTANLNSVNQQGSALNNLSNYLKTNSTQFTTLGAKVKDTFSKFSGFATGLSATTSGFLQLGAGARDYGDAQIAVDKAQRKLSLSQEALNKATDKLTKLQHSGSASSKDLAQAQLDVKQAQEQLNIQTQLLGESQERMFDSQTQFVASVIPTTLGAIGTLGSAFKDLGLKGDKLKGAFTALSGSLSGGVGGIKGYATSIGLIGSAAVIAAAGIDQYNRSVDNIKKVTSGAITPTKGLNNQLDDMTRLDFSSIEHAIQTIGNQLGPNAPVANILKTVEKTTGGLTDLGQGFKNSSADFANWAANMLADGKSIVQVFNWLHDSKISDANATKIISAAQDILTKRQDAAKASVDHLKEGFLGLAEDGINVYVKSAVDAANNAGVKKFWEFLSNPNPTAQTTLSLKALTAQNKTYGITVGATAGTVADLGGAASKTYLSAVKLGGSLNITGKDLQKVQENADKARQFIEKLNQSIAQGTKDFSVGFKIKDNADKFLKELINNIDKKARKGITVALQLKADIPAWNKVFTDALDTASQLSDSKADAIAKGIIKTIDEKFKGTKGQFAGLRSQVQEAIADPHTPDKLRQLLANMQALNIPTNLLPPATPAWTKNPSNWIDMSGSAWQTALGGGASGGMKALTIPTALAPPDTAAFDSAVSTSTGKNNVFAKTVTQVTKDINGWTQANNQVAKTIVTVGKDVDTAIKSNNTFAKTIVTIGKDISSWIKDNNTLAKTLVTVKKDVDSLVKSNNTLARTLSTVAKDASSAASKLNSVASAAKKAASAIKSVPSGSGIHVGASVGAAQHGMHTWVNKPTTILAGEGGEMERVDITPAHQISRSSSSSGGGGFGGSGNTIIENHVHILDENIMRRFTARQGKNRYVFGA